MLLGAGVSVRMATVSLGLFTAHVAAGIEAGVSALVAAVSLGLVTAHVAAGIVARVPALVAAASLGQNWPAARVLPPVAATFPLPAGQSRFALTCGGSTGSLAARGGRRLGTHLATNLWL